MTIEKKGKKLKMENKELIVKKCLKCGAVVKVVVDDGTPDFSLKCCDEEMKTLIPNTEEAAVEKHVPTYEIKDDKLLIKVNHVMEDEHYIEWVSIVTDNEEYIVYFKPGMEAKAEFKYVPGSTVYAYCNKHGLWKVDVK